MASRPSAAQLADRFLHGVLPQRLDVTQHALPVASLCAQVGWAQLQPALAALVQQHMARTRTLGQAAALMHSFLTWLKRRAAHQPEQQQGVQQEPEAQQAAVGQPQPGAVAAAGSFAAACGALAPCCALLVEAACSKFEAAGQAQQAQQAQQAPGQASVLVAAPSAQDMARLLESLTLLGLPEQLQQAQRLLPHAVQRMDSQTVSAVLRLHRRFGWAAIQPAAEQLVARCESDAALLPHTLSLLRQLAEAAVGSGNGGNGSAPTGSAAAGGPVNHQQGQQQRAAAGKENAGPAAACQQPAQEASKPSAQLTRERELQQRLAGLLAAVLDVVLREADLPAAQATAARQSAFLVDVFAAVHTLLPAVGLLPCRAATVGGLPLTGLADRLALLSSRVAQQEQRYPLADCLHPACKALHTLLGERAEAGGQLCRGVCNVAVRLS